MKYLQNINAKKLTAAFTLFAMLGLVVMLAGNGSLEVFANDNAQQTAQEMIKAILTVVYNIVTVVGIIFVIVGIVKFAIAYANESGPDQQKAAMMMATGIVLILLPAILRPMKLETKLKVIS